MADQSFRVDRRSFVAAGLASALAGPAAAQGGNPLTDPWPGPYGGLPPFDKIRLEDFEPGFEAAMAEQNREIAAIVANRAAPTFANTILAQERSGAALNRARPVYGVFTSLVSTPELRTVQARVDAKLAAHGDAISQNAGLFARIDQVYRNRARLSAIERRLVERRWEGFVRAGAKLPAAEKTRVAAINQRMSALHNRFQDNLLADEDLVTPLTEAQMDGLPDAVKTSLRAEARTRNLTTAAALPNKGSSVGPYLMTANDRAMREQVFKLFSNRGDLGGATDSNAAVAEILKLRAERAKVLGFKSYAHWRLEDTMAKTPEAAMGLMQTVWAAAIKRVGEETAQMQEIASAEGKGVTIEPWDATYYADKVRKARYALDLNEARPYLQLDKLREAMFWVAGEMHGLFFTEIKGVATVHPDIRVWEVHDRSGAHRAVWYFDPFARPGKRAGAWAAGYRTQETFDGKVTCITSNNSNFLKPAPGEPVLIDWGAATTLFHEFGHAVHAMLQDIPYSSLGGLPRDYVEFPSQLSEHWLETDEVLSRFALHHATGVPLPKSFRDAQKAAKTFNQGFSTVRLVSTGLMDMKLHLLPDGVVDPDAFERTTLAELSMPKAASMAHRIPQSYHFFSSENYAAGYYGYLWSDALVADAAEVFEKAPGGYYDKPTAQRFRQNILSKGNSIPPADQFRAFRGRDVDPAALMRKKGFVKGGSMLVLLGVAVVVVGFAVRINPLLVVVAAAFVTGWFADMTPVEVLAAFGKAFNENRLVSLSLLTFPLVGVLERAGLQEQARALISGFKRVALAPLLIGYFIFRQLTAAIGLISIAGQATTVRPVVAPMAEAAAARDGEIDDATRQTVRAHAAAVDNVAVFFGEDIFIAIGSILLIVGFANSSGIAIEPLELALWAIPSGIAALLIHGFRLVLLQRRLKRAAA